MRLRVLLLLLVLTVATSGWYLLGSGPGFPLDDAWMHLVYGRSLATGNGFAFNGAVPEAGVTAPLWTLAAAASELVCVDLLGLSRADGGLRVAGAVFTLLMAWTAYRLNTRAGKWPAAFTAVVLLLDPLSMYARFSGMELPLFGWLSLLLMQALLDNRETRAGWICGLLLLTRPEALVLLVIALAFALSRKRPAHKVLVPALVCALPWMLWNYSVSGRVFPNTVAMKSDLNLDVFGWGPTIIALMRDSGWGWALPLLLLTGAISLDGGWRLLGRLQLVSGLALVLGVLATREMPLYAEGDSASLVPFYWQRHALLAWPLLVSVTAAGLGSLVRTGYAAVYCRPGAAVALAGPLIIVLVCARFLPGHALDLQSRFAAQCAQVEGQNVAAGLWIDQNTDSRAVVATHDTGAVRYFGKRRVLDIYGNHDKELATLFWNGELEQAAARIAGWRPDVLVAFPLTWAVLNAGPELARLRDDPVVLRAVEEHMAAYGEPMAAGWGLTRRAATFHVSPSVTVPGPLHEDLAIFVAP